MSVLAFGIGPLDLVGDALGWIAGKAGEVVANTAEGLLNLVSTWILDGAFFVTGLVIEAVFSVTSPQVTSSWFAGSGGPYRMMFDVAASLMLGAICLGVLRGVVAGDIGATTRRFTLGVPAVVFVMTTAVIFTQVGVDIVDQLSAWVWDQGGANAATLVEELTAIRAAFTATGGGAVVPAVLVVVAIFLMITAMLVFIVLIIRSALIYLLVALIPLAVLALVTGHRSIFNKTMEMLVAFVVAKLVIVLALVIGASAFASVSGDQPALLTPPVVSGPDGEPIELVTTTDPDCESDCELDASGLAQALGAMFVGVVAFGLGVFSPWLLMRLMPGGESTQTAHPGTGGVMQHLYTARSLRPHARPPAAATPRAAANATRVLPAPGRPR